MAFVVNMGFSRSRPRPHPEREADEPPDPPAALPVPDSFAVGGVADRGDEGGDGRVAN